MSTYKVYVKEEMPVEGEPDSKTGTGSSMTASVIDSILHSYAFTCSRIKKEFIDSPPEEELLESYDMSSFQARIDQLSVKGLTVEKILSDEGQDKFMCVRGKTRKNVYNASEAERGEKHIVRFTTPKGLSLSQKLDILKALNEGKTQVELAKQYQVSQPTISLIRKRRDLILNYVRNSVEHGEECNLRRMKLPRSTPVFLSLSKKAEILEAIKTGQTRPQLAEKYGVSISTIRTIVKSKDKILSYVQSSIDRGGDEYLRQISLPHSQPVSLPTRLTEKYGINTSAMKYIQHTTDISYIPDSIAKGEEYKLKRTALSKKVNTLEQLGKGESLSQIAKEHQISKSTADRIQKTKRLLSDEQSSIKTGKENNLQQTVLPRNKRRYLPLSKKIEILANLKKGYSQVQLAKKYEISQPAVSLIYKKRNQILSYVQNSIDRGEEHNLRRKMMPSSKLVSVPLSKKAKYSQLEIEDWQNKVIKEEHIDYSDDEATEEN